MKTAVIFVAIFGLVFGDPVTFEQGGCDRMNVDATFEATVSKQGSVESSQTLVTKQNEDDVIGGSCTATLTSMIVYFNSTDTKWTLTFTKGSDDVVSLLMMIQLDAQKMFPDKNFTDMPILSSEGKMVLSTSEQSFKCMSEQEIKFTSVNASDNTYDVTLKMKNLQVQGFQLPQTGFSTAKECEQDAVTTEPPPESTSEQPETTTQSNAPSEETTSEKPSSETTTQQSSSSMAPTTTEAPKPDVVTFEVKEDNATCIKMQAAIAVAVEYETTDNKTETAKFFVPKTATAEGSCGNGSDTNASLTIDFPDTKIEFMFMDKDKKSDVEMVTLSVTLDEQRFPNAKDAGQVVNMTSEKAIAETDDATFYLCNAGDQVKFEGASMLDITDFKVQAFNLKEGDFSGAGSECAADKSTTVSSSPATTTPKPKPSGPPVNNYTVNSGNGTCLMMKASLVLDISYTDKQGKGQKVELAVPTSAKSQGTCGETVETLTIEPFDGWKVEMVFSAADGVSATEDLGAVENYQLTNISVTYKFDDHLPNNNRSGETVTEMKANVNLFGAKEKQSYKCNANTTISFNNDLNLKASNFRYQAFQTNSTQFNDDVNECEADVETNSVVPIAVGAALAGLVVIVLIAYLIGRRKSRRQGYESV